MPTPAKTSPEVLVAIALELISTHGADAVTVSEVAKAAGVKGPSIYKHFEDREALLKAAEINLLGQLERYLRQHTTGTTPLARLQSMANAYRRYANAAPHLYGLLYRDGAADDPEIAQACLHSARPLFEELEAAQLPAETILPRSRTVVAFIHGFVSMEIARAFRLGGDVDEAFEEGLKTVLAGL